MERYGRRSAMEGSLADPALEWSSPGGETGLEEPMWQLGLGSGLELYPERPDEANCIYYLRTGFCGYGARCRFNHPRDRSLVVGAIRPDGLEFPERVSQPVCQYYMRTGMCKFGSSCKYHHPRQGVGSAIPVVLNIAGYPFRPGEKECSYYLQTGQCKFGVTCKFHHPQPACIQVPGPTAGPLPVPPPVPDLTYPSIRSPTVPSPQQYGVVTGNWPVARPALIPSSYLQGPYSPMVLPPGMVPFSGWNPYQTPAMPVASPSAQSTVVTAPIYGLTQLLPSVPAYTGAYFSLPSSAGPSSSSHKEHMFPERPGQPECPYYMKTGDCKFGLSCRYHHPAEWSPSKMFFALSPMGLPLRPANEPGYGSRKKLRADKETLTVLAWELYNTLLAYIKWILYPSRPLYSIMQTVPQLCVWGAPLCMHYAQNGVCKFGFSCKFDHPMGSLSYSPSASSLADMPVAPYPVGSAMGTLAPSSSSSDLRRELISGSSKDALSNRMYSSMSTSSGLVGSAYSHSGSASYPSVEQSGEPSTPSKSS